MSFVAVPAPALDGIVCQNILACVLERHVHQLRAGLNVKNILR